MTPLNIRADIQPLEMKAGFARQGKTIHIGVFTYTGKDSNYNMMDKYFTEQLQYSRLKNEGNTLQRERMVVNKSQNVETHYRKQINNEEGATKVIMITFIRTLKGKGLYSQMRIWT